MPKIKLFRGSGHECYDCGRREVNEDTGWITVTEEEVRIIRKFITQNYKVNNPYNYTLLEYVPQEEHPLIMKDFIAEAKKQIEKEELEAKIKQQKQTKRLKTMEEKRKAKEVEKLRKLMEKYPNAIN